MRDFMATLMESSISMSILALGFIAMTPWLSKRYSAKWLYYAWLVILTGLIIPFRFHPAVAFIQINPVSASNVQHVMLEGAGMAGAEIQTGTTYPVAASWYQYAAFLWIAGGIAFIAYHGMRHYRFIRMVNRWGEQVNDPRMLDRLDTVARDMGIAKAVRLRTCPWISSPMMIGSRRPVILLPASGFTEDESSYILRHELVHIKRRDLWFKGLVFLATAVHWFNPVVYIMARAIAAQCEISCDAVVVNNADIAVRRQYSKTILGVIKNQYGTRSVFSTSFYGGKKTVKKRVLSIMDTTKKKTGIIILCLMLIGTMATGAVFAFSKNGTGKHGNGAGTITPDGGAAQDGADANTAAHDGGADENTIVRYADLTHDGRDEKIVVDLSHVDTLATGDEQTVRVYNKDTLIWSSHADTAHVGWNGIYLYSGSDGYYLMEWKPYGSTGFYNFTYAVFSLSENGGKIPLDSQEIDFDQKNADTDPAGLSLKITEFCVNANAYLSNSILLIDTDGGTVAYSTDENQIIRQYDPSALLGELGIE